MPVLPHVKKASRWAPFAFVLLLFSAAAQGNNCKPAHFDTRVTVSRVYDGDTLKLADGRKLRLIGLNTPERGRDGRTDEPFYRKAKQQLQRLIQQSNHRIHLLYGQQRHDRHGRLLAHPFTADGKNISAQLLRQGLGFLVAIAPNVRLVDCYQQAEQQARQQQRGIWSHPFSRAIDVRQLPANKRGFARVIGTVQRVGESRSSWWLNLKRGFALRILKKDQRYFDNLSPRTLLHQRLIASGWIYQANGEQRMTIRHPAALQLLATDAKPQD